MTAKTRVASTTLSTLTSFTVAANLKEVTTSTTPAFTHFGGIDVIRKGESSWDYAPKQYYPASGKPVNFYAYSPAGSRHVESFTNAQTSSTEAVTIKYTVPFATKEANGGTPAVTQEDLLVSKQTAASETVKLDFIHALSRINFSAVNLNTADLTYFVEKVELKELYNTGELDIAALDIENDQYKPWWNIPTSSTNDATYSVTFAEGGAPVYGSDDPNASKSYRLNTPEQGLMVLPQTIETGDSKDKIVVVTCHARNGAGVKTSLPAATFELAASDDFSFNINTQYNFIFTFSTGYGGSGTAISFEVKTVADWNWGADDTDVPLPEIRAASNTYMVTPSGSSFFIPVYDKNTPEWGQVSRAIYDAPDAASKLPINWLDNTKLKVGILWSDVNPATNTVVEAVALAGSVDNNNLRILLTPGAAQGNALVILYDDKATEGLYTEGEDEIKWSWLIWNTTYKPTGAWMDRNLGAMANAHTGDTRPYGFMYQWGRKDPLNHAQYNSTTGENFFVYNNGSAISTLPMHSDADNSTTDVSTWVNNPMIHYYDGDQASGLTARNNYLWSPAIKTVYDPCPSGWRIPHDAEWTTANFVASWADFGYENINEGGYYPGSGYQYGASGTFDWYNGSTFYPTDEIQAGPPAKAIRFSAIETPVWIYVVGGAAVPVRCHMIP
jgi:hypothetical protein